MSKLDAIAGEYVLGTLSEPENIEFEELLAKNEQAQAAVSFWTGHLSPLLLSAGEETPSVDTKVRLFNTIKAERKQQQIADDNARIAAELKLFRRSRNRWRGFTAVATSMAAGIAAFVFVQGNLIEPQSIVPDQLAVLSATGSPIQFIATIDPNRRGVHIRPLFVEGVDNPFAAGALQMWVEVDDQQLLLGNVSSKKWQWLDYSDLLETDQFLGAKFYLTNQLPSGKNPLEMPNEILFEGRVSSKASMSNKSSQM